MKNIIVGQSGGPTAVINGSLYGVVTEGLTHPDKISHVYGMINGIEGFLNDRIMDMNALAENRELEFVMPTSWSAAGRKLPSCPRARPGSAT